MLGRVNVSEMEHGVRDAAVLHAASGGQNTTVTLPPLSPQSVCVCVWGRGGHVKLQLEHHFITTRSPHSPEPF